MKVSLISNIFAPYVIGGYELGCQSVAEELLDRGHDVEILTSEVTGQLRVAAEPAHLRVRRIFEPIYEYDDLLQQRHMSGTDVQRHRTAAFGGINASNALALARALAERKPDVIWIFNPLGLGPIGILEAALTQRAKCVIHLMDHVDSVIADHQDHCYLLPRLRRLKRSFHAISCSRKILAANEIVGSYQSHRVIYNGVRFGKPRLVSRPSSDTLRLVYFGQITSAKGVGDLLHGFAAAKKRQPTARITLDLLGRVPASFEDELRACLQAGGVQEHIRLIGFLPRQDLLTRLLEYDAAIMLLSDMEPFPYAPLEAAEAGLPVIITSRGGIRECLPEPYPLAVADRSDHQEVADAILWCIRNREALPQVGQALRQAFERKCDLNTEVMPAYLRTIKHIEPNPVCCSLDGLLACHYSARAFRQDNQ